MTGGSFIFQRVTFIQMWRLPLEFAFLLKRANKMLILLRSEVMSTVKDFGWTLPSL